MAGKGTKRREDFCSLPSVFHLDLDSSCTGENISQKFISLYILFVLFPMCWFFNKKVRKRESIHASSMKFLNRCSQCNCIHPEVTLLPASQCALLLSPSKFGHVTPVLLKMFLHYHFCITELFFLLGVVEYNWEHQSIILHESFNLHNLSLTQG